MLPQKPLKISPPYRNMEYTTRVVPTINIGPMGKLKYTALTTFRNMS